MFPWKGRLIQTRAFRSNPLDRETAVRYEYISPVDEKENTMPEKIHSR